MCCSPQYAFRKRTCLCGDSIAPRVQRRTVTVDDPQRGSIMIDFERLRRDLTDDRYAGAFAGVPAMIMGAWNIESASESELLDMAQREGIDLKKYDQ